jgi:hypothetical protein
MKHTKPWLIENLVAEDDWHTWLAVNAVQDLEYQLLYRNDTVIVEFFDQDRAEEFAQEFGL